MKTAIKDPSIYASRKRANFIGLVLSMSAMAIGLIFLLWILSILMFKGFAALSFSMLSQSTPAPGSEGGGLANAIVGSLIMTALAAYAQRGVNLRELMTTFTRIHAPAGELMQRRHLQLAAGETVLPVKPCARSGCIMKQNSFFPEATISRSMELKEFKSGAVRIAAEAGVPLVPVILWGTQRMMTKGHPRDFSRGKTIAISVGEPVPRLPSHQNSIAPTRMNSVGKAVIWPMLCGSVTPSSCQTVAPLTMNT